MPNYNNTTVMGHLARDPEVRFTGGGLAIANCCIAVNNIKKGGEKEPCFIDFTAFGQTAEYIQKYHGKGSALFVDGYLKQDSWEDKQTGAKRSKLVLVANKVEGVGGRTDERPLSANAAASKAAADDDDQIPF